MAKIINCKSCNKEIASNAKVCPGCGAKNKKPIYKSVWFWIIIVIIIGAIVGGGDNSSSNTSDSSNNSNEVKVVDYMKVDIDELEDALDANAAAAKDTYNGKYLEISGRLGVIDSDLKYISLLSTTDSWDLVGVHCSIKNKATRDIVKTLSKDQTIIVKGKITDVGEVFGYYLNIDEIIPQ